MDNVTHDIAAAPLPTPETLHRRNRLGYQLGRFIALNLRFVTMIFKGDH